MQDHEAQVKKAVPEEINNVKLLGEQFSELLSELFKAMCDPTRLQIIHLLFHGTWCVNDIASRLNMSQPAISHHLRALRQERLVKVTRQGKNSFYALDDDHVRLLFNAGMQHIAHSKEESTDEA